MLIQFHCCRNRQSFTYPFSHSIRRSAIVLSRVRTNCNHYSTEMPCTQSNYFRCMRICIIHVYDNTHSIKRTRATRTLEFLRTFRRAPHFGVPLLMCTVSDELGSSYRHRRRHSARAKLQLVPPLLHESNDTSNCARTPSTTTSSPVRTI